MNKKVIFLKVLLNQEIRFKKYISKSFGLLMLKFSLYCITLIFVSHRAVAYFRVFLHAYFWLFYLSISSYLKMHLCTVRSDIYTRFSQKFSITGITFFKNLEIQLRLGGYNITPLPYPATQSLLPSPLKPQLYHIPIKSHTHTFRAYFLRTMYM